MHEGFVNFEILEIITPPSLSFRPAAGEREHGGLERSETQGAL